MTPHARTGCSFAAPASLLCPLSAFLSPSASHCYRLAYRRVEKALQHSYEGRKQKKRQYRSLWIARINAGARAYGVTYGRLVHGMAQPDAQVQLNRKMLAQLAIYEPFSFQAVVHTVQTEAAVPLKEYPTFGLLQTSVTADVRPVARQPAVHLWREVPSISDRYFKAQQRRLDAIAEQQAEAAATKA